MNDTKERAIMLATAHQDYARDVAAKAVKAVNLLRLTGNYCWHNFAIIHQRDAYTHAELARGWLMVALTPDSLLERFPHVAAEFPDYDLKTLPEPIPADWQDISWHNDACPCFSAYEDEFLLVRVYVDYEDRSMREYGCIARFNVISQTEENETSADFNHWQDVLDHVAKLTKGA